MPRIRITPFGGRKANSNANQNPGRFQLNRTKGQRSQLEWEFGQEPNALFQLHSSSGAPADLPVKTRQARADSVAQQPAQQPAQQLAQVAKPQSRHRSPFAPNHDSPNNHSPSNPSTVPAAYRPWQRPAIEGEIVTDDPPFSDLASEPIRPTMSPVATPRSASSANGHRAFENGARDPLPADQWRDRGQLPTWGEEATRSAKPAAARSQLANLFTGEDGMRRVLTTRIALDDALDRWWTHSEVAPLALLRDGLLVLEAGHELDETQRSFLLRTALRTGKGMVTALHYQLDADRTAFLLKEALLDTKHAFDPTLINDLRVEDEQSGEWADYLEHDLAYEATVASGKRSQLAALALDALHQPLRSVAPPLLPSNNGLVAALPSPVQRAHHLVKRFRPMNARPLTQQTTATQLVLQSTATQLVPLSHRWSLRWLLWTCLIMLLLLSFSWPQLRVNSAMIEIPAGTYLVSDPVSTNPTAPRFQTITVPAYRIDQREVSNAAYRRCWEQHICLSPSSFDSQTRPGYFANRSFDTFPVVNIQWQAAETYCHWVGKRLPSLDEWEVAASLAPATGRRFVYPWGDRFDVRVANSAASGLGDTQPSGTYHPAGSTSTGLMDMAGNVAEWTAMPAASMVDGAVVKGGSFLDDPQQLRNSAHVEIQQAMAAPWLGFRCAADE